MAVHTMNFFFIAQEQKTEKKNVVSFEMQTAMRKYYMQQYITIYIIGNTCASKST